MMRTRYLCTGPRGSQQIVDPHFDNWTSFSSFCSGFKRGLLSCCSSSMLTVMWCWLYSQHATRDKCLIVWQEEKTGTRIVCRIHVFVRNSVKFMCFCTLLEMNMNCLWEYSHVNMGDNRDTILSTIREDIFVFSGGGSHYAQLFENITTNVLFGSKVWFSTVIWLLVPRVMTTLLSDGQSSCCRAVVMIPGWSKFCRTCLHVVDLDLSLLHRWAINSETCFWDAQKSR